MREKETVLTPVYRFILGNLDKNGLQDMVGAINRISQFAEHFSETPPELSGREYADSQAKGIVDETLNLLRRYGQNWKDAYEYWTGRGPFQDCKECLPCQGCMEYYWKELGEILFGVPNAEKADRNYFPLYSLPDSIARHFEPSVSTSDLYRIRARRNSAFDDKLFMLKGMSSSTPALLNSAFDTDEFAGGGFFFCWKGYGVAVDPGYHYIQNLHHYGLSVLDINAVIVTHEHIDHNSDIRLLEDILTASYDKSEDSYKTRWYLDKVSYELACVLRKNGSGFCEKRNELYCIDPARNIYFEKEKDSISLNEGIELGDICFEVFQTRHIWDENISKYREHTFGCKFTCRDSDKEKVFAYTSDTRYFPELSDFIGGADIVIANISGIYEDDYMLVREKDRHLGYYGCHNLICDSFARNKSYPRYLFLSEFWNGKSDIRYDVSKELQCSFEKYGIKGIKVVPSEIGMIYDLREGKIQCSQCRRFSDKIIVQRPTGLKEKINIVCDECYY